MNNIISHAIENQEVNHYCKIFTIPPAAARILSRCALLTLPVLHNKPKIALLTHIISYFEPFKNQNRN